MRIDAHDDYLEGGLTIEEVIAFCKMAKEAGVTMTGAGATWPYKNDPDDSGSFQYS